MGDPHYPSINSAFLQQKVSECPKVIKGSMMKAGSTVTYVLEGRKALHKRLIIIREITPGEISFENATAIALTCNFMGTLLKWLEQNKGWKDGAYTEGG